MKRTLAITLVVMQLVPNLAPLGYRERIHQTRENLPIRAEALAATVRWMRHGISGDPTLFDQTRGVIDAAHPPAAVGRGVTWDVYPLVDRELQQAVADDRVTEISFHGHSDGPIIHIKWAGRMTGEVQNEDYLRQACDIALSSGNDDYRTKTMIEGLLRRGTIYLVSPPVSELDILRRNTLFYLDESFFVVAHGGPGRKARGRSAVMPYALVYELMRQRSGDVRDSRADQRVAMIDRVVRLLFRHELQHAMEAEMGSGGWEDPIEVNEILSLLVQLGFLPRTASDTYISVPDEKSLQKTYEHIWRQTTYLVSHKRAPDVVAESEAHSITLVAGGRDFSADFNARLDALDRELVSLGSDFYYRLAGALPGARHLSLFALVLNWQGVPFDMSILTMQQIAKIRKVLNDVPPFAISFTGMNLGPDGVVLVEGHPHDDTLFRLRRELAWSFPDPYRRDFLAHITLRRPMDDLTPSDFQRIYRWVEKHRDDFIGTVHVRRPYLRKTDRRFGLADTPSKSISFHLGGRAAGVAVLALVTFLIPVLGFTSPSNGLASFQIATSLKNQISLGMANTAAPAPPFSPFGRRTLQSA